MNPYETVLLVSAICAVCVFVSLLFVSAPYGRHAREGWGPVVPSRLGWVVMEAVAAVALLYFFFRQAPTMTPTLWVLIGLWELHYINRAFIYPLRMRTRGKTNPLTVVLMAMGFNTFNGYLNGHWLGIHAANYTTAWVAQPNFAIGFALFVIGFAINLGSDEILLHLRREGDTGYAIPRGGLYRYVSCPNYLGELIEWCGWALMTWSPAGLVFALWTAANLVPRARSHHQWYNERFADYPRERKAIIPFVY